MNEDGRTARLTPWVTRLIVINGAVLLFLATVFTAPRFLTGLSFDPAAFGSRPWTVLTYMFVHDNVFHLALNSLVLFVFGPPVERRLGGRRFIAYYLYCGVGAALFALSLAALLRIDPFVGASGAAYGISLGFVLFWPAAELRLFPLPVAMTARSLFVGLLTVDVALGLWGNDGIAHFAHFGGALAGYAFFRLQSLTTRRPTARPVPMARRPVVTPMRVQETAADLAPPVPMIDRRPEISDDEVDRLLDKIAQCGIESLTSQERKVLSDASERKRREQH